MNTTKNTTTITVPEGLPFIDVEREFDATPAQVYSASSEPDLVKQWLGPAALEMTIDHYDVRPGGSYAYTHRDADGNEYGFRGVFHTVEPGVLVIQTFEFEGARGFVTLESATYEDLGGRTRLTTHSVFPTVESRDEAVAHGMAGGIEESMERLDRVLASGL